MTLRPHQDDMITKINTSINNNQTKLIVDACPAYGKSLLMSEVARLYQDDGVLILINISALLDQISYHLTELGVSHSILKADRPKDFDPSCKVQLVMSQTLHARRDKIKFDNKFRIYQQDEMHRENPELSERSKDCVELIKPEIIIGYSGTPYDSLGYKFNNYYYLSNVHAQELQDKGYLCPIRYYIPKWSETIDYSTVKKSGNDYNTQELEKILNTSQHLAQCVLAMNHLNAKNKKTIVFCSSIEQADNFTKLLQLDGYEAHSYHSKTEFNDRILDAFINNSTFNREPAKRQASLIDDDVYPNMKVKCLVSINKLGIGFDSPDTQLGVQLRPTKVRSLAMQQITRVARTHESKQFAEYLDLGQTTSNFGFHTDIYIPPIKTGDKSKDIKSIQDANAYALEDVRIMLSDEPTEVNRHDYELKVSEVKAMLHTKKLEQMQIFELANAFEVAKDHKDVIRIATAIYTFKFGKPISKEGKHYSYRPEQFWGTSTFGNNVDFHVHHTMEEYFNMVPEMKDQWIKALKTRCRNIIKQGDKLFKITGFIKYMYDKYIEDGGYDQARKRNDDTYDDAVDTQSYAYRSSIPKYEDYPDDEIPFSFAIGIPLISLSLEWYNFII